MAGAPSGARRGLAKLITISLSQGSGTGMDNRSDIWLGVDAIKPRFIALSDKVWAMPEVCYTEARSAAEHLAELRHQGFRITENIAGIPTALMGEWGEGGPVIAFLGEYDALPGLSQEADVAEPRPLEVGGHGHGCGHNLLGSAALLAATAVKDWLAENKVPGRVRYYGCPAEEGGAAKTFMVRSGAFDDADIAITWHPSSFWEVAVTPSLANTRADFIFTGRAAQGAALMTETRMEMRIISAVSNVLPNTPLEQTLHRIMEDLGPPRFDEADEEFAAKIRSTLTEKDIAAVYRAIGMDPTERPLADFIVPLDAKRNPLIGSTDVGDVSWVVPTVQVHAPTVAIGTPFHTWQIVAQGKTPAAHKAMVQAAKAMAGLGVKALNEPGLIEAAKADLTKRTARTPYVSPLPDNVAPPLDMSVT